MTTGARGVESTDLVHALHLGDMLLNQLHSIVAHCGFILVDKPARRHRLLNELMWICIEAYPYELISDRFDRATAASTSPGIHGLTALLPPRTWLAVLAYSNSACDRRRAKERASGVAVPYALYGDRIMRVICTSRHNERNIGDRATSPANYFPWLRNAERIDLWDTDLSAEFVPGDPSLVIVGGIGVFGWGNGIGVDRDRRTFNFDTNVRALSELGLPNTVLWGVGHESRDLRANIAYPAYIGGFRLVGLRDYLTGTGVTPPSNYEWSSCPSCMHPVFDDVTRFGHKSREVVIYDHLDHRVHIDDSSIPRLDHYASSMTEVIEWLGSAETVITTSYHGALWATFVGARVIIPRPWATKLLRYKHMPVVIGDEKEWQAARKMSKVYPYALDESRRATERFAGRVHEIFLETLRHDVENIAVIGQE